MSPRLEGGFASHAAGLPLLLQCDRQGRVIWLSERGRSVFQIPGNLVHVLECRDPYSDSQLRLSQIVKVPGGLLLGAEPDRLPAMVECHDAAGLCSLTLQLLHRCFRLQTIERSLSIHAARRKRGGGRLAIRQIELERQRVGLELHTGVGQMLAAIRLQTEIVTGQLPQPSDAVRHALGNIATLAAGAFDQVRSISRRLHPPEWQRLTIEAALRQLWELSGIPLRFDARLRVETLDREPDPEVKALLYRTAQEGLSNIMEHSGAKAVSLALRQSGDLLTLVLEDDGIGFDPAGRALAPVSISSGIGLRAIAAQAAALGAKMDIASGPNGTTLVLSTHFSADS